MWFRYFSKESWNLRVWRKANLKFNQDDFGMYKTRYILRWKDFVFRLFRTEGAMRGFNFFFGGGVLSILIYLKSTYYDPAYTVPKQEAAQRDLQEKDRIAKEKLFYNRVGAPSRPLRSLDDMITFLSGSQTFDEIADFISYNAGMDINMDQQKGLDSWMTENDKNMLKYYQQSVKKH